MKPFYIFILFVLSASIYQAQFRSAVVKKVLLNKNTWLSQQISPNEIDRYSDMVSNHGDAYSTDTIRTSSSDTMKYNMYGDLRVDNPAFNVKSSIGMVAIRVTLANVTTFAIDRYIFNYDFSRVGFNSWKHNIEAGWEWDIDRFAVNYFFHPYAGSMYFNSARANGYSFYESIPFAFLGSIEWEYFFENTQPSYNDFINTPISEIFLEEIFYRLGPNILDDQTSGIERILRETAVAIITPTRFFSRLLKGELARSSSEEIYQKEPLNVTLAAGYHRINEGIALEKGSNSFNFTVHLDYGNPFEKRSRKPFDFFKVRTDFDFGVGRKLISLITGYGILFGQNIQFGNMEMLVGFFQHMNFFDNKTFELGSIAFGPGLASKLTVGKNSSLYTNLHVGVVPFGGLSNRFGPDTTQVKDYNYAGGAEVKLEATYNINSWIGLTFIGYYWWLHSYAGIPGETSKVKIT